MKIRLLRHGVDCARFAVAPLLQETPLSSPVTSKAAGCPQALLVHPGTQYSGQLARQLERLGMLAAFHTGLAFADRGWVGRLVDRLPRRLQRALGNRRICGVPPGKLETRPLRELLALAEIQCGADAQAVFFRRNGALQRSVAADVLRRSDVVIGFDTSSWILARRATQAGRPFLLDRSIGHPRALAAAAARLDRQFPEWQRTTPPKSGEDIGREEREHADALRIVVPSRFVSRTLTENGIDPERIRVNPFGVDLQRFQPAAVQPPGPLRFLFVGALLRRKGVPLLLDVWKSLPANHGAELLIVGGGAMPAAARRESPPSVRLLGQLPQADLPRVLQQAHVFVFPSYFEGLAQVQIEAAACGLPVIGTESSGAEEIVHHGETGFVLPVGDADALRATLLRFIEAPELVSDMRERLLLERARWSWDAYGERWRRILHESVGLA